MAYRPVTPNHPCPSCGRSSWCHFIEEGIKLVCRAKYPQTPEDMEPVGEGVYAWKGLGYADAWDEWLSELPVMEGEPFTRQELIDLIGTFALPKRRSWGEIILPEVLKPWADKIPLGYCTAEESGQTPGDVDARLVIPLTDHDGWCGALCFTGDFKECYTLSGCGDGLIVPGGQVNGSRAIVLGHGLAEVVAGMKLGVQVVARREWGVTRRELGLYLKHVRAKLVVVPISPGNQDKGKALTGWLQRMNIQTYTLGVPEGGLSAWTKAGNGLAELRRLVTEQTNGRERKQAEAA